MLYFLKLAFIFFIAIPCCWGQNNPPAAPASSFPLNNATGVSTNTILAVNVADPDLNPLSVAYYIRPCPPAPGPDFTIAGIPDTQYYTSELNGGKNAMYKAQMNWIVANRVGENIVFVEGLGDCVQNGDGVLNEWKRVDTCVKIIENPATTSLTYGIPYGMNVGNHDQTPEGSPGGTTLFNQFFGEARFTGRPYYGGHYGSNNNNNYVLFSAGGLDFIVINIEFSTIVPAGVIAWLQNILTTYSNRRAIIGSHNIMSQARQFGAQGQAIYNTVRNYPNVFLMLCGHLTEEAHRTDHYNGNTIHTLLSDYQARTNGGNGWMRLMKFSPANNTISVKTFSPWLNQYETDTNSQFSFSYNMQPSTAITLSGSNLAVPSGSVSTLQVNNLQPNTCYEWYATASDGISTATSPVWKFTTGNTSGFPVTLNLRLFLDGYYKGSGLLAPVLNATAFDSVRLDLYNPSSPYAKIFSATGIISLNGNVSFNLPSGLYGNSSFLSLKHRSSIETWSSSPLSFNSTVINYDFTTASNKAYGSNQKVLPDGKFAFYTGDVNNDCIINATDFILLENAASFFQRSYSVFDLNGDYIVESSDFSFMENRIRENIVCRKP